MKNISFTLNLLGAIHRWDIENSPQPTSILPFLYSNKNKQTGFTLLKELVRMMSGEIEVKNEVGQNATFLITIPKGAEVPILPTNNNRQLHRQNRFLQKVESIIEENIEDDGFGIPELCRAIGISRSQLHNKVKASSNLSTSIYIRSIRLRKAHHLLNTTDLNVSEVAYSVGYKDPSYFSRLFSDKYGVTPMKVRPR